jgi:hypothetical protein
MSRVTIFPTTLVCGADRLGVAASSITSSALAEFAHEALHMIERNDHLAAEARLQAVSDVRQMLDEEGAKLRANPDLDPVRRTRALAEFMREDRRAIEVHNRLAAKAVRRFDFAATLEAIWEEKKPEIERRRQQILAEVADAERAEMSNQTVGGWRVRRGPEASTKSSSAGRLCRRISDTTPERTLPPRRVLSSLPLAGGSESAPASGRGAQNLLDAPGSSRYRGAWVAAGGSS